MVCRALSISRSEHPAMKSPRETPEKTALRPVHSRLRLLGDRGVALLRPDADRWNDPLRHDERHQHGAEFSHGGFSSRQSGRSIPRRASGRLPQHPAARHRASPDRRPPWRPVLLQGRQQQLHRSDPPHPQRADWSAVAARTARRPSPGLAAFAAHSRSSDRVRGTATALRLRRATAAPQPTQTR